MFTTLIILCLNLNSQASGLIGKISPVNVVTKGIFIMWRLVLYSLDKNLSECNIIFRLV